MSEPVENPEDWFSGAAPHIIVAEARQNRFSVDIDTSPTQPGSSSRNMTVLANVYSVELRSVPLQYYYKQG